MEDLKATVPLPRRSLLIGFGALTGALLTRVSYGSDLVVIVHPDNAESPSRAQLAALFTTRKQSWGSGARVVPFNFPPKHGARVIFDQAVLGMSPDEVARYWIDRRIRGGAPPPKSVHNAQMLVQLVVKLEGAIAYVPRELATGVRVLLPV